MSKVVRRKELLATPAISMTPVGQEDTARAASLPPLHTADGKPVQVVHVGSWTPTPENALNENESARAC